jgi:N-succinyldiaminopimelate aminotransferase
MTPRSADRIRKLPATVFSAYSALAQKHAAVNLGQGFPDFDGPEEVLEAAKRAISEGKNQYAVGAGASELRRAIAQHAERFYGQHLDPETMISVTSGATEGIADALLALIDPGDEVVMFEPFYDSYTACVTLAHGAWRAVTLYPPDNAHASWWFDARELEAAFTPRTKLVLLNTPHNPTGKVFTGDELSLIAELCRRHDALAVVDEVYEHLVYAPARHQRLATLPGMAERTLTLSSGGKSFSMTGWKVGWAMGPPALRQALQQVHQYVTFATATPLQAAMAAALTLPDSFFQRLTRDYTERRGLLLKALADAGLPAFTPEGSYFVLADVSAHSARDDEFCRALTERVGVAAIPLSPFLSEDSPLRGRALARFAFCKQLETLRQAERRLQSLPERLPLCPR